MQEFKKNDTGVMWVTKAKAGASGSDADVYVSTAYVSTARGNRVKHLSLTFRNKVWARFKSDYVIIGLDGARMCFMPGDQKTGYKLSDAGSYSRSVKSSNATLAEWAKAHTGDYPLEYDSEGHYWFVNTERS